MWIPLVAWNTTNWKILQEMGIPDHLSCLLRNLYAGQEATVRTRHWTTDWSKLGKEYKRLYRVTLLFNLYSTFSSVTQLCPIPCDPMDCSMPGFPVHHQLKELTQTHVHLVSDAIQPSHPLSSPSPPALNLSKHQGLFKWVSSSHRMPKELELQLQHQSFQ